MPTLPSKEYWRISFTIVVSASSPQQICWYHGYQCTVWTVQKKLFFMIFSWVLISIKNNHSVICRYLTLVQHLSLISLYLSPFRHVHFRRSHPQSITTVFISISWLLSFKSVLLWQKKVASSPSWISCSFSQHNCWRNFFPIKFLLYHISYVNNFFRVYTISLSANETSWKKKEEIISVSVHWTVASLQSSF